MMKRSQIKSRSGAVGFLVINFTVYLSTASALSIGLAKVVCLLSGARTRLMEWTTSAEVTGEPSLNVYLLSRSKTQVLVSLISQRCARRPSYSPVAKLYEQKGPVTSLYKS